MTDIPQPVPDASRPQLRMRWPARLLASPPPVVIHAGYRLRQYADADEAAYLALREGAGFSGWAHEQVEGILRIVLPDGFFLIEHGATGRLAATALATHKPIDDLRAAGELGWVAGDPAHKGLGLGTAVCAAVVDRFLRAGYRNIYLLTDDFRLPALAIYLKLGFEPWCCGDGMVERWQTIGALLRMTIPGIDRSAAE